jgi:hypothetical protein
MVPSIRVLYIEVLLQLQLVWVLGLRFYRLIVFPLAL